MQLTKLMSVEDGVIWVRRGNEFEIRLTQKMTYKDGPLEREGIRAYKRLLQRSLKTTFLQGFTTCAVLWLYLNLKEYLKTTLQPFRAIFKCLKYQRYFYFTLAFFTYEEVTVNFKTAPFSPRLTSRARAVRVKVWVRSDWSWMKTEIDTRERQGNLNFSSRRKRLQYLLRKTRLFWGLQWQKNLC